MSLQKSVFSELMSQCQFPRGSLTARSQTPAVVFKLPQLDYSYNMGICRSITKSIHQSNTNGEGEWAPHLLTDGGHDPTIILSSGKISLGLHRKTINPFLIVLSRGTGNLLHNSGWPIYIRSSIKESKVPQTNLYRPISGKKITGKYFKGAFLWSWLYLDSLKFLKRYSRSESSKLEGQVRPTALNSSDNQRFVTPVAMLRPSQTGWTPLLRLHRKSWSHHPAITPISRSDPGSQANPWAIRQDYISVYFTKMPLRVYNHSLCAAEQRSEPRSQVLGLAMGIASS